MPCSKSIQNCNTNASLTFYAFTVFGCLLQIMIEAVLDEDTVAQSGEGHWPFGPFVEQLMHDMFDPG
jgi:hypothetical protein